MSTMDETRLNAGTASLALFDFDGTITQREMFPDFVHRVVAPRRLAIGKLLLAPLIIGYKLGWVSGSVVRAAIVRFGFTGIDVATFEAKGRAFADAVLVDCLRPEAMQRIRWHQARGDTVVVVSGAFDVYLKHWCKTQQLALICSSLAQERGVLTGRYAGPQCVGMQKAARVRERYDLSSYARIYAYGDTKEDLDLLALAHEPYYQWQPLSPAK